jgi:hypothetical protein
MHFMFHTQTRSSGIWAHGLPKVLIIAFSSPVAIAQEPNTRPLGPAAIVPPAVQADDSAAVQPSHDSVDQLARALVLSTIPREYENTKDWGHSKLQWNGVDVELDGLRIKTKRRWKPVNHGTWTRYRAWLIDPERQLQIRFENLRPSGNRRVLVDVHLEARCGATGRVSQWNRGIQLYSFHADAEASIQLQLTCEIGLEFDTRQLPPDVLLKPKVLDARLQLRDFQLQRISDADGPLVRRLGDSLRGDLEREVNERCEQLVEKLNRSIEKRSDQLRLSPNDLLSSGWNKLLHGGPK